MEPVAPVNFASRADHRPADWQQQARVDFVVNRVMQSHRGHDADQVAQALEDQLRGLGVAPNDRMIHQYATAIARLPQLSPESG